MSRKNRNRSRAAQQGTPVPNTVQRAPVDVRDFGLLTVRSMQTKQSEAIVYDSIESTLSFAKMSNARLIAIVKGTDLAQIREVSRYFAQTNGIYARAVRYLSDLYKFDFTVYPNLDLTIELGDSVNQKILKKLNEVLEHFDNSSIQLMCRKWAAQVCLEGIYYGYICDDISDKLVVQDLPVNYCRSRFLHRGLPFIEFNVTYFDKVTKDTAYRDQLLNLFPEEFRIGYKNYKENKLPPENQGDKAGWIPLDVNRAFKFNFYDTDIPPFLYAIPALIELSEVQDLEKEKLLQELQKILVQTFELDKNGQIPFTMTELQKLNQNAIDMVGDAVGVSVLSTVSEVHLEDLAPESGSKSKSSVEVAENNVYNDLGISANLFNTSGNLALEKSIATDEAYVKPLLLQFEQFFNNYITGKFNKKDLKFRLKMLTTTIFNYKEVSNAYKDLTKIGFSRLLPMVALGHTQKEVVSMAKLEEQILDLDIIMLPPFSSNTMSSDTWLEAKNMQNLAMGKAPIESAADAADATATTTPTATTTTADTSETTGRPETPDEEKSDKTIANQESSN